MREPAFLSVEDVEEIHRDAIAQFGGTLGLRDAGTLEAAVFHPQNAYLYSHSISTDADSMPVDDAMIAVAKKEIGKPELAALLRKLFPE